MKVAIYCRLSEEDRNKKDETDDSESIQNQKSMLIGHAMSQNWEVYNIYSDDDYTGADRNRPDFNRLLHDAENKKFDIVLCKTQSRFTRELEIVEKYIHYLFPLWGIRFVSIVDNADTDIRGNKKSRQINGLINEWYLEDMSENIKSVLTNRRENGCHIGAFALYGYLKDPDKKGHLIIDEEAAHVVREIFTLFSQGYGKTAIARILNDRGIPNPTEYKRLKGLRYKQPKNRNSTLWKYTAISDMLINEIYIGHMVQGKYGSVSYKSKINKPIPKEKWIKVNNTHEPIIDMDLWNKVQDMIKQKCKPFSTGKVGIFANKARCMNCGYTMRSSKNHNHYYLKCNTKHVAKDACIGAFISVSELEKAVIKEIQQLMDTYLDTNGLAERITLENRLSFKRQEIITQIETYKSKVKEYSDSIKSLYVDKTKGVITDNLFLEFSKDFHKEKVRLEQLITDCLNQISSIDSQISNSNDKLSVITQYTTVERLDRDMVEKLIDYVSVGKRDPETHEIPIEIYWNF